MKQVLLNQKVIQKLSSHLEDTLNGAIKKFKELPEKELACLLNKEGTIYASISSEQEMFCCQIQGYDVPNEVIELTDGELKIKAYVRGEDFFENSLFLDSPLSSIVIVRKWNYELWAVDQELKIVLVIEEIQFIDIITTIFECKGTLDFLEGYSGNHDSITHSQGLQEYSKLCSKKLSAVKKLLVQEIFQYEEYNSTRQSSQPKLLFFKNLENSNVDDQQYDFGEGCLLKIVSAAPPADLEQEEDQNSKNIKKRKFINAAFLGTEIMQRQPKIFNLNNITSQQEQNRNQMNIEGNHNNYPPNAASTSSANHTEYKNNDYNQAAIQVKDGITNLSIDELFQDIPENSSKSSHSNIIKLDQNRQTTNNFSHVRKQTNILMQIPKVKVKTTKSIKENELSQQFNFGYSQSQMKQSNEVEDFQEE